MRESLLLFVSLALAGCATARTKKLGISGATCTASSDCASDLQCVRSTCADWTTARPLEVVEAAMKELAEIEGAAGRECAELDAKREAEGRALAAELQALRDEQDQIRKKKDEIEQALKPIAEERLKLLCEQAALDAELAEAEEKKARASGSSKKAR